MRSCRPLRPRHQFTHLGLVESPEDFDKGQVEVGEHGGIVAAILTMTYESNGRGSSSVERICLHPCLHGPQLDWL